MRDARAMAHQTPVAIPVDLRPRLEAARLNLLALFRALNRLDLSPAEIPQRLIRQLFELDGDYAEALWALDQPPQRWTCGPCSAIPWPPWINERKPVSDSVRIYRNRLYPVWPNWKYPSAKV